MIAIAAANGDSLLQERHEQLAILPQYISQLCWTTTANGFASECPFLGEP
jgi:hypothetical protein